LVLEKRRFKRWKMKLTIWTKNWRNSTQLTILWELWLKTLIKNKPSWISKLESKENILGLRISELNISKTVFTRLCNLFKTTINLSNTLKNCKYFYTRFKNFVTKDLKLVEIDSDIKAEYISQKKYLEKSVNMLKKNLIKV
jgi:hypothetical protein